MKNLFIIISLFLTLAQSEEIVLVAADDFQLSSMSTSEVKRLYLGKSTTIDNIEIQALNQEQNAEITSQFLDQFLGMNRQKYIKWWLKQQIIGRARPLKIYKNEEQLIEVILKDRRAIGYIYKSQLIPGLKVITIN